MKTLKYTMTSTFIFPLVELPKKIFLCNVKNSWGSVLMTNRFLNAYLYDKELDFHFNEEPYIFLLINPYKDVNFERFHDELILSENYIDEYEKEDFLVVIFKISDQHLDSYELLLKGKYSKISMDAKQLIIRNNFWGQSQSIIPKILGKDKELKLGWEKKLSNPDLNYIVDLKDQEVWPIIQKESEGLDSDEIKKISKSRKLAPSEEFEN